MPKAVKHTVKTEPLKFEKSEFSIKFKIIQMLGNFIMFRYYNMLSEDFYVQASIVYYFTTGEIYNKYEIVKVVIKIFFLNVLPDL